MIFRIDDCNRPTPQRHREHGGSRPARWSFALLALAGVGFGAHRGMAQTAPAQPLPGRLTVRPHEMATGTRTAKAGEYVLDSIEGKVDNLVYVPPQCVGTRRCPLVVDLAGGGETARFIMDLHQPLADRYGMILLAPEPVHNEMYQYDVYHANIASAGGDSSTLVAASGDFDNYDVRNVDAALKQVLQKFAIDPDKIAVTGSSNGGLYTLFLARHNLDVFSRVAPLSPINDMGGTGPAQAATQFFVASGIAEPEVTKNAFSAARESLRDGHPVKEILGLRPHAHSKLEADLMWRWFQDSWADPGGTARTAAQAAADSVPVLTPDILTRMTTFWTSFGAEPDSIQPAAFGFASEPELEPAALDAAEARQKPVPVRVGQLHVWVINMGDMPAFAAKYPSVAADLAKAGLTAQQEEAYRAAFLGARLTQLAEGTAGPVEGTSALSKNLAFIDAHQDKVEALETMMGLRN